MSWSSPVIAMHGEGSGQKLLEEIPPVVQIVEKENPRIVVPRYGADRIA